MSKYKICLNDILNNLSNYNLYFACLLLGKYAIKLNIGEYQFKQDIANIENIIKTELDFYETPILDIKDAVELYDNNMVTLYDEYILKELMEVC